MATREPRDFNGPTDVDGTAFLHLMHKLAWTSSACCRAELIRLCKPGPRTSKIGGSHGKRGEIIIPILSCSDLDRSLEYYQGALGFKVDWTHDGSFASVSRNDWKIYLHENPVGEARGMVWVGIEEIEDL